MMRIIEKQWLSAAKILLREVGLYKHQSNRRSYLLFHLFYKFCLKVIFFRLFVRTFWNGSVGEALFCSCIISAPLSLVLTEIIDENLWFPRDFFLCYSQRSGFVMLKRNWKWGWRQEEAFGKKCWAEVAPLRNQPENCSSQSSSASGGSGNTTGKESCPLLLLDEVSEAAEEEGKLDLMLRITWGSVF